MFPQKGRMHYKQYMRLRLINIVYNEAGMKIIDLPRYQKAVFPPVFIAG